MQTYLSSVSDWKDIEKMNKIKKPKVSIIIPIYNTEDYLEECLTSVAGQTLHDIEIICVNDGSVDASLDIIAKFAQHDDRFVVIDKENTGYGDSVNRGIRQANGDYIGIVESDDYVDKAMFERLYDAAKEKQLQIVKSNYWQHCEETGDTFYEFYQDYNYNSVLTPSNEAYLMCKNINLWSGIYSREFLIENNIWFNITPGASYQDVSFTIKAMSCAESILVLKDAFYHYRLDNPNSSVKSKGKVYCICDEFNEVWSFLDNRPEIYDSVKTVIPFIEFLRYRDTFRRIDDCYKPEFYVRMIEDFNRLNTKGLLEEKNWTEFSWTIIHNMLGETNSDKEKYNRKIEYQKSRYNLVGIGAAFIADIRCKKNIYIYGAGKVGKSVSEMLDFFGISYNAFLVSNTIENEKEILGKKVIDYKEIVENEKDATILVAVKDDDQLFVIRLLEISGMSSIVSMNKELRNQIIGLKKLIGAEYRGPRWVMENEIKKLTW